MDLTLVTASTGQPVSLEEAKDHLRVTDTNSDADIARKLRASTDFCQRSIGGHKQFMEATYDLVMEDFPPRDGKLELPLPPLRSITSVTYITSTGGTTTMPSTDFITVTPTDEPGFIEPAFSATWPSPREQANAVTVRFVAGYDTEQGVPDTIKQAIMLMLGHFYVNREAVVTGTIATEVDLAVKQLLGANEYGNYR